MNSSQRASIPSVCIVLFTRVFTDSGAQCIDGILTAPPRGEYDEEQLALLARHARPCPMCRAEVNRASLYRASAFFDPAALEEQFDAEEGEADEDTEVEEGSSKGKKRAVSISRTDWSG